MSNQKNKIVIIDGSNLCKRYEAMEGVSKWAPTSLVFNHLLWIIERMEPSKVLIAWEGPGSRDPRKKIFEGYKSDRDKLKKKQKKVDIRSKRKKIAPIVEQHIVPCLPIYQVKEDSMEADDIIAALVNRLNEENEYNVIIISSDHDFYQLVNKNTVIYNPISKKFFTLKDIQEEYGIRNPYNISWIKAIIGDNSDSIPGCPGCGLKTAQKKLHEILNSEDLWTSEQIKELMKSQKNYNHEDIEMYWRIIQLMEPLNIRAHLQTKKRLDYIFSNPPKYDEKKLMKVYVEAKIYIDIPKETIQRKLLVLSEYTFKNKSS